MKKYLSIVLVFCFIIFTPSFAFSDVPESHWAYDKIEEMHLGGVISGFEDGTFKPNDAITREQVSAVLSNFFEVALKSDSKKFEDVAAGYWSEEYNNLIGQYMPTDEIDGKYYFRPFDNATRAEVAETIIKLINYDNEIADESILEKFSDKDTFSEKDKKYISLVAENGIMVGDDNSEFRPNDTITRAEFCTIIYNINSMKETLQAKNSEKTVMTVNGDNISFDEFRLYFGLQKVVYETMLGTSDIWKSELNGQSFYDIVKDMTKTSLIENKVKLQKAEELGIKLTEEEQKEINESTYDETASEICDFYNITSEQLYQINLEGKLISKLIESYYNTLDHSQHTHADINSPVDTLKYNSRHILLSTEGLTEDEKAKVKESAEELLTRVKNGEDFATLAKEYSNDIGSKENGGLYEDISLGEFVPEFEEAALSLSDGMIYPELVESSYGYHIIKLENKIETTRELTDDEKQEIMAEDLQETVQGWVENAVVDVNEDIYKSI